MKNLGFAATAIVSLLAVSACTDETVADELAGPDEAEPADGKGDAAAEGGVNTYFEISRDMRKCAFPMCSGFFIDRLNASTTKCHDNKQREACYTPELDMSESGLSDAALGKLIQAAELSTFDGVHAIVRGRFAKKNLTTPQPNLGRFVVTEVWIAQSAAISSGVFAKVADNGVRCFAAPCASISEKALNTSRKASIADIDFSESQVPDSVLEQVGLDMFEPHGVIIAGDRYNFSIDGRAGKGRTATAVYRRMKETNDACFVGGCSSQICSDQEGIISTCEFRPEYACYQAATCERQPDNSCGWTPTAELSTCLGNAGACCDPAQNPGGIEGAHCCADGSWRGDIGNGGSDECIPFGGDGQVCN
jgi:hypothetical protein